VSLPGPRRSRGSGCRAGWPSYSHRPASIDLSKTHSHVASLAREPRSLDLSTSRAAPHGASSDGPPAPHRLEQPSPYTTPISDIPRRRHGHRLAGSRTDRKLAKRTPCDVHPALNPRDLDRRSAAPCGTPEPRSECLPSCRDDPGLPLVPSHVRCPCLESGRDTRTVLTSEPPGRAPARHPELSSASAASFDLPCGSPYVADARCVGPTSAISLFVPVPAPRRFSMRRPLSRPRMRGDCLIHVSANSLRRVARDPFHGAVHRDGRCLPVVMRADRASDTPVASPSMA